MRDLVVGDPVIVYKPIWMINIFKCGRLYEIFELDNRVVYRVYFYDRNGRWLSGCNIFTYQNETIELNIEEVRNTKLNKLGI